ncbi:MAG: ribosomal protein [Candidatus Parcubacteria bacterium]
MAKKVSKKTAKADAGGEFAVILTGGKQYRVQAGDTLMIEKLAGEHKVGDTVIFDKVLLVDNTDGCTIGDPYIKGAAVHAEFKEHGRSAKVRVVKYKAKARYLKQNGHRQPFSKLTVTAIK